ncbi:MAG TPA: ABC transporter ATP-binding protein [Anaerolineae bacterium]|nr:ABC transporter ATP-binding protein [Anaerolineae bacterium]
MSVQTFEEEEFEGEFNGQTIWRILKQARPHWPLLVGFLGLITLVAVVESYMTFLQKRIIDEGIAPADTVALRGAVIEYGVMVLILAAGVYGFIYCAGVLGERVRYDLRRKLFNHLQSLSFSYFDKTPVGWIMSRTTSDTERIADLVTWGLLDVTWGITSIGSAAVFMLLINWRMALIVLVTVPILVIVASEFKRRILAEYRTVRKINSQITGAYNESITGVRVVKSLAREEANLGEFQGLTDTMFRASYRASWLSALFLPLVQMLSAFAVAAVVWYGGWQVQLMNMTVGDIQAFIGYITFMMWPVLEMARVYAQMQQAIASAERVFALIDAVPEVRDRQTAVEPVSMRGEIRFEKVQFAYEADKPVLRDFDLTIKEGETIALVGPTGSGKSTVINLLCRFYDPTAGRLTINGQDYRDLTLQGIHSRLGMVLQVPHLFSGTVRENIRYGRLEATDEEVEAAAQLAGAETFIKRLSHGYDEEVGESGNRLSMGQKQLISLARAILADPDIFIMDEATSSVDTLTEALIQQGMERLMHDRTSLVIAHRLSTIRRADRILVIENGQIAEMGTHSELLRQRGHYYRLYTQQFKQEQAATRWDETIATGLHRGVAGAG